MMNDQAIERTWGLRTCGKGKDLVYGLSFKPGTKNPGTGSSLQMLKTCVWGHEFIFREWVHSAVLPRNEKWQLTELLLESLLRTGPLKPEWMQRAPYQDSFLRSRPQYSILPLLHCQLPKPHPEMPPSWSVVGFIFQREAPTRQFSALGPQVCRLRAPESLWLCTTLLQAHLLTSSPVACWASTTFTWVLVSAWVTQPLSLNPEKRLSYSSHVTPNCCQLPSGSLLNFPVS